MAEKTIDKLIDEAHFYFNDSSTFEVIDTDDVRARDFLLKKYNNPDPKLINSYLEVISRLKLLL